MKGSTGCGGAWGGAAGAWGCGPGLPRLVMRKDRYVGRRSYLLITISHRRDVFSPERRAVNPLEEIFTMFRLYIMPPNMLGLVSDKGKYDLVDAPFRRPSGHVEPIATACS